MPLQSDPPSKPVVVVFTGNSTVGSATIQQLYAKYEDSIKIRAVVRKEKHALPSWTDMRVEVLVADVTRKPQLEKVFDQANVALWVTPCTKDRAQLTSNFLQGCIDHGIDFPVIISMTHADEGKGLHLSGFKEIEDLCNQKRGEKVKEQFWDTGKQELQPIILRCGQFFQNIYGCVATINAGKLYYPLGAEGTMPIVDLQDIAECAAIIMMTPEKFANRTLNILCTYASGGDLARSISMKVKGTTYEPVPGGVAKAAFKSLGLAAWIAEANVELLDFYTKHQYQDQSDIKEILDRSPTSFSSFCKTDLKKYVDEDTSPCPWLALMS